jgi:hypothetical protein
MRYPFATDNLAYAVDSVDKSVIGAMLRNPHRDPNFALCISDCVEYCAIVLRLNGLLP